MFELLGCALVAVFGRSAVLMTGTGWVAGSTDIACELRRCEIAPRAALRGGQTIRPERPNSSTKKPARARLVSTTHAVPSTLTGAVIVPVHVMRNGGMGSFA